MDKSPDQMMSDAREAECDILKRLADRDTLPPDQRCLAYTGMTRVEAAKHHEQARQRELRWRNVCDRLWKAKTGEFTLAELDWLETWMRYPGDVTTIDRLEQLAKKAGV